MGNRQKVYILTFFTYAIVHMMRMTYSFNKHTFQKKFGISDLFLGFLDTLIFASLAIGTFFRYSILNDKRATLVCLKTAIPTAITFSIIPFLSLIQSENWKFSNFWIDFWLIFSCFGFGFFQFTFFPSTLTIFSHFFNVKTQGTLVGIWSSKSNAGNIIGFFFANFLVYQLHKKWEVTMFLCSILLILITILLYLTVQDVEDNKQQITTKQFFQYMKSKWRSTEFKLYIFSFSFFKAILYSYQFWTPKFLSDVGYARFSGYIPMVFDISTLFGSFMMGKLYQDHSHFNESTQKVIIFIKKYKFFIASLFIIAISLFYLFVHGSLTIYFILAVSMGFFLGAVYNSLQNNQILSYTQNNPRNTDMFSTINIGIGSSMVALFQFIIGIVMHIGQGAKDHSQQKQGQLPYNSGFIASGMIYVVIAILGVIAMILTYLRSLYQNQHKIKIEDKNQIQMSQINTSLLQNQRN